MPSVEASNNPAIFVTGGTGFIGTYLLRALLNKGYTQIRALRRSNSPMDLVADFQDRIEWVEGDLLDTHRIDQYLREQTWVFHAAAMVSFDPRDRRQMRAINVDGTANLVNLSLLNDISKFLHVSSIAAIGRPEEVRPINEAEKWERNKKNSQYAISKYQAEMEVWRGMAEGLKVAIVNPSVVIGSGYWDRGTARFFRMLSQGYPFYPLGATGFVDVRDVADFSIALMESPIQDQRFILNQANWSYQQFFQTISEALEVKPPRYIARPWMGELLWRLEWIRARLFGATPLLTRESARSAQASWEFINDRSRQALNFTYRPLERTIRETAALWREAEAQGEKPMLLEE
jgi:dihydroflavonol-4-reductase